MSQEEIKNIIKRAFQNDPYSIVFLIGAGLSMPKYYSWAALIEKLGNELLPNDTTFKKMIKETDFIKASSLIVQKPHYQGKIVELFESKEQESSSIPHNYQALLDFSPKILITTNYDNIPDTKFVGNVYIGSKKNSQLKNRIESKTPFCLKIHGALFDEETIILSESQFRDLYEKDTFIELIKSIVKNRHIVSLGFSFSDSFLPYLLDKLYFSDSEFLSLNIFCSENDETKIKNNIGTSRLFNNKTQYLTYENFDGSHSNLKSLISEIFEENIPLKQEYSTLYTNYQNSNDKDEFIKNNYSNSAEKEKVQFLKDLIVTNELIYFKKCIEISFNEAHFTTIDKKDIINLAEKYFNTVENKIDSTEKVYLFCKFIKAIKSIKNHVKKYNISNSSSFNLESVLNSFFESKPDNNIIKNVYQQLLVTLTTYSNIKDDYSEQEELKTQIERFFKGTLLEINLFDEKEIDDLIEKQRDFNKSFQHQYFKFICSKMEFYKSINAKNSEDSIDLEFNIWKTAKTAFEQLTGYENKEYYDEIVKLKETFSAKNGNFINRINTEKSKIFDKIGLLNPTKQPIKKNASIVSGTVENELKLSDSLEILENDFTLGEFNSIKDNEIGEIYNGVKIDNKKIQKNRFTLIKDKEGVIGYVDKFLLERFSSRYESKKYISEFIYELRSPIPIVGSIKISDIFNDFISHEINIGEGTHTRKIPSPIFKVIVNNNEYYFSYQSIFVHYLSNFKNQLDDQIGTIKLYYDESVDLRAEIGTYEDLIANWKFMSSPFGIKVKINKKFGMFFYDLGVRYKFKKFYFDNLNDKTNIVSKISNLIKSSIKDEIYMTGKKKNDIFNFPNDSKVKELLSYFSSPISHNLVVINGERICTFVDILEYLKNKNNL